MDDMQFESWPRAAPKWGVYLLGALGGIAGAGAAIWQNTAHFAGLLTIFVAPVVEELCKPIGLIIMLDKRPHWLGSAREVVVVALISALVFATLENLLYIFVNAPGRGAAFAIFRFTVPTSMHLIATGIFAAGMAKTWRRMMAGGKRFDINICFRYYLAAVIVHAAYNGIVALLAVAGVINF